MPPISRWHSFWFTPALRAICAACQSMLFIILMVITHYNSLDPHAASRHDKHASDKRWQARLGIQDWSYVTCILRDLANRRWDKIWTSNSDQIYHKRISEVCHRGNVIVQSGLGTNRLKMRYNSVSMLTIVVHRSKYTLQPLNIGKLIILIKTIVICNSYEDQTMCQRTLSFQILRLFAVSQYWFR